MTIMLRIFATFIFACCIAGIGSPADAAGRYTNAKYGFSVSIPKNAVAETAPPPAPQHGFSSRLGTGRRLWIDASYDAQFLGSARAASNQLARDEHLSRRVPVQNIKLAALPARRFEDARKDSVVARIVAYRSRGTDIAIIYTIGLDTDPRHKTSDMHALSLFLKSFAIHHI